MLIKRSQEVVSQDLTLRRGFSSHNNLNLGSKLLIQKPQCCLTAWSKEPFFKKIFGY